MNFKLLLSLTAGAFVGNYLADNFVIKNGPNDSGFVEFGDGIGLDDLAKAATIAVSIMILKKVIGG